MRAARNAGAARAAVPFTILTPARAIRALSARDQRLSTGSADLRPGRERVLDALERGGEGGEVPQ